MSPTSLTSIVTVSRGLAPGPTSPLPRRPQQSEEGALAAAAFGVGRRACRPGLCQGFPPRLGHSVPSTRARQAVRPGRAGWLAPVPESLERYCQAGAGWPWAWALCGSPREVLPNLLSAACPRPGAPRPELPCPAPAPRGPGGRALLLRSASPEEPGRRPVAPAAQLSLRLGHSFLFVRVTFIFPSSLNIGKTESGCGFVLGVAGRWANTQAGGDAAGRP